MAVLPVQVKFIKISEDAKLPERSTAQAAGFDIFSAEDVVLEGETKIISTGLKIAIPLGYEGQVRSRSGLATRGVYVANSPGTIDSDYRGELKVILHSLNRHAVKKGDRIAQLLIKPVVLNVSMQFVDEFDATSRGEGGFGSTGE